MIELPEAAVIAEQISKSLTGRTIETVTAAYTPNKFAWYNGNPEDYNDQLKGKRIEEAVHHGGMVQIQVQDTMLLFSDGIRLLFHSGNSNLPEKHQLLIRFTDNIYLSASVQMYGGIICSDRDDYDNKYYRAAVCSPDPLSENFTLDYFLAITGSSELGNKSIKFVTATEQRIPGLGNGTLQDVLFNARVHPKRKWNSLSGSEISGIHESLRRTIQEIIEHGGRDTEKDLFGNQGGYKTKMSKNTAGSNCAVCGMQIQKASYMGGSIYFCSRCQKL